MKRTHSCMTAAIFALVFILAGCSKAPGDYTLHYDGDPNGSAGWSKSSSAAVLFPAAMVKPYQGGQLTKVRVYFAGGPEDATVVLKVYGASTAGGPGPELYSQGVTAVDWDWNEFALDEPVTISGGDIWVGFDLTVTGVESTGYSHDGGPQISGRNYFKVGTSAWSEWPDNNLNIRAIVTMP